LLNEKTPILDLKGLHNPLLIDHSHVEQLAKVTLGDIDVLGVILSPDIRHIQGDDKICLLGLQSHQQQQDARKVDDGLPPRRSCFRTRSFTRSDDGRDFVRRDIPVQTLSAFWCFIFSCSGGLNITHGRLSTFAGPEETTCTTSLLSTTSSKWNFRASSSVEPLSTRSKMSNITLV
jgi:hypothetical protein